RRITSRRSMVSACSTISSNSSIEASRGFGSLCRPELRSGRLMARDDRWLGTPSRSRNNEPVGFLLVVPFVPSEHSREQSPNSAPQRRNRIAALWRGWPAQPLLERVEVGLGQRLDDDD